MKLWRKSFFTWFAVLCILFDKKYSNFILPLVSEQYNNATQWSESLQHLNPKSFKKLKGDNFTQLLLEAMTGMTFLYLYVISQLENYFKKCFTGLILLSIKNSSNLFNWYVFSYSYTSLLN